MKHSILVFLAVAAVAAPVANAAGPAPLTPAQRIVRQENARRNDPALLGSGPAPTTVTVVDSGGFHWDDAGIGAAVAVAVMLVCTGSALVLRAGHPRGA